MMASRIVSCLTLLAVTALLTPTCAFSVGPSQQINRRDAVLATAAGLLIATPPASAELDLSKYQDGPRGIKYLVTTEGAGTVKPVRGQKVRTSYTLYLNGFPEDEGSNSKKIDSSKGLLGDQPFEFNLGTSQVIKGWDLSLLDMVQGEARRLIIPAEVGYGDQGAGNGFGGIPGGATLYFDVLLVELGKTPTLDDTQRQWLEQNPL